MSSVRPDPKLLDPKLLSAAPPFQQAQIHAQSGQFTEMLIICEHLVEMNIHDSDVLVDIGVLLLNFGFITRAKECFMRVQVLAPDDLRSLVNLANIARDIGEHAESRRLYSNLLIRFPNNPVIRRNALVSLDYDPVVTDMERLDMALAWAEWAVAGSGGARPRPVLSPLNNRQLRIGYVSADFCQHTVGLFVKDVLKTHDSDQVTAFVYSAGLVKDWLTDAIRSYTRFRDVAALNDIALAELIREDCIDVLVDLSGHTAGSRLTVFTHRPAPVQVSWLGYFATTGLSCMDAVLLDQWHAPAGVEAQFIESIVRLPVGRFCYQPVPWAPTEVASLPSLNTGQITFGCFNNTGKINAGVFDVWTRILAAVPDSRLVLKWRTFNDDGFGQSVRQAFINRGIASDRLELRGPSFHIDMLKEYADIDIALDPFPFTGGLTSCEALWMGLPVVTWPQGQIVSRQTFAFLSAIGLPELAAQDADDYVRIAVALAEDKEYLAVLRKEMRARMRTSLLMNLPDFTHQFEQCLIDIYQDIYTNEKHYMKKTILHVGPGHRKNGSKLPQVFITPDWREVRLDIDPNNEPDIVGSMLDMVAVENGSVDAIYSAHNIEHVYAHEVPVVLKEFLRVLKPDGFLLATCPDLQTVCALVAEDRLTDAAYTSQAGPITPLDILYGHREALAQGHLYMAHKCGFTEKTLTQSLQTAGFQSIAVMRRLKGLDLWVVAGKALMKEAELRELAEKVLPT
jgi:predicted SAM-dependent methyltransferase/tetratricopeptide (TPR) repeat protein